MASRERSGWWSAWACASALLVVACRTQVVDAPLGPRDPVAESRAREVARIREAYHLTDLYGDAIWPGFDLRKIPILVSVDDREELLFGHPHPPEGFRVLDGFEIDGAPIYSREPVTFTFAGTARPVNGEWTGLVTPSAMSKPGTDFYLTTLLHECFHAYQARFRGRAAGNANERFDAQYYAFIGLESRILAAVLDAGSDQDIAELARMFVAVREARLASVSASPARAGGREDPHASESALGPDQDQALCEAEDEFSEGTATYAQTKLHQLLADAGGIHPIGDFVDPDYRGFAHAGELHADIIAEIVAPRTGRFDVHHSKYFNGMAICFLLDRVRPTWKQEVSSRAPDPDAPVAHVALVAKSRGSDGAARKVGEAGGVGGREHQSAEDAIAPNPWGLVMCQFPVPEADRAKLLSAAQSRFGYDELLADQATKIEARLSTMREILLAPGTRYRISYSGLGSAVTTTRGPYHLIPTFVAEEVDRARGGDQPSGRRSVYDDALICEGGVPKLIATGILFESEQVPVVKTYRFLEWVDRSQPAGELSIKSVRREGSVYEGLRLTTPGFTLSADRAEVAMGENLVEIRVIPPPGAEELSGEDRLVRRSVRFVSANGTPVANRQFMAVSSRDNIAIGASCKTDASGRADIALRPGRASFIPHWPGAPAQPVELDWNSELPPEVELVLPAISDEDR